MAGLHEPLELGPKVLWQIEDCRLFILHVSTLLRKALSFSNYDPLSIVQNRVQQKLRLHGCEPEEGFLYLCQF